MLGLQQHRERQVWLTTRRFLTRCGNYNTMRPLLYVDVQSLGIRQEIERTQASSDPTWQPQFLARFELQRGDLSEFLKELKQRLTQWYDRRKGRRGTLWDDRFKSVRVEGSEAANTFEPG